MKDLIRSLAPVTDFFGLGDEIWQAEDPAARLGELIAHAMAKGFRTTRTQKVSKGGRFSYEILGGVRLVRYYSAICRSAAFRPHDAFHMRGQRLAIGKASTLTG